MRKTKGNLAHFHQHLHAEARVRRAGLAGEGAAERDPHVGHAAVIAIGVSYGCVSEARSAIVEKERLSVVLARLTKE